MSNDRCPICGETNECAAVTGAAVCWCFSQTITTETLAKIPAEAQGKICICQTCANAKQS